MNNKSALAASLMTALSLLVAVSVLNGYGTSRRTYERAHGAAAGRVPVQVVKDSAGVYALWKQRGVAGRVVVQVGRYFNFVSLEDPPRLIPSLDSLPASSSTLLGGYEQRISHRNFLWVAMQTGMVRQIFSVLPPELFREKISRGKSEVTGDGVELWYMGLRRTITDRLPKLREPVLLDIDASYFTKPESASSLARELAASGLEADLVTVCLSQESPDVTDVERARLADFLQIFTQGTRRPQR